MIDWLKHADTAPEIELVGKRVPIELNRHPRAKRLTLRLAADGSAVRITLPPWARSAEAIAFAHARSDWLTRQLAQLPEPSPPRPGSMLHYRGQQLRIDWRAEHPRKCVFEERRVRVGGPRDSLVSRLQKALEAEALSLFASDRDDYCRKAALAPAPVRISRAKRRWGSCSSQHHLRINWRLVQAPDFVRRSVVAHEVAHLVHFDHSASFHALLEEIYESDLALADAWLKTHGRTLYASFG